MCYKVLQGGGGQKWPKKVLHNIWMAHNAVASSLWKTKKPLKNLQKDCVIYFKKDIKI